MKGNIDTTEQLEARDHIGSWLRDKRQAKGLSQAGLADLMEIRHETVSKVEAGKWAISIDMLALFCKHLGISIQKIFK